jgi:hypothetical protein
MPMLARRTHAKRRGSDAKRSADVIRSECREVHGVSSHRAACDEDRQGLILPFEAASRSKELAST